MTRSLPRRLAAFLLLATFLGLALTAQAQLQVDLTLKRRIFIINEPLIANVTITNLSGRDVILADTQEGGPWFSFQISSADGHMVPARDPNYQLQALSIRAGETLKRAVNLNDLYSLGDYGSFRLKASVYFANTGKFYSSPGRTVDLTEGRAVWKKTVGLPEGAQGGDPYRTWTLLTMEQEKGKMLYARLQGEESGTVYCCCNLGRMVDGFPPDAKLDGVNNLAVLQLIGPRTFLLSRLSLAGQLEGQQTYVTEKTMPYLRRQGEALQIVNAVRQAPKEAPPENLPKVSDRPPGF